MRIAIVNRIAAGFVVLGLGAGAYLYLTRPVAAPTAAEPRTPAAADEGTARYLIVAGESKAEFVIDEVLNGEDFTVRGATGDVSGEIVVDLAMPSRSRVGEVKVNARTLRTDNPRRDGAIGRFILRSEEPANEFIVFRPAAVSGLPATGPLDGPFDVEVSGDLTIRGVTRPVTFVGAGLLSGDLLKAQVEARVAYADFGLSIPKVPFVAWVADELTIKVDLAARRAD